MCMSVCLSVVAPVDWMHIGEHHPPTTPPRVWTTQRCAMLNATPHALPHDISKQLLCHLAKTEHAVQSHTVQRTIIYIQLNCFCHAHLYIHFYSLPKRRKGFFLLWQQLYQQLSFQTGNMQWNQYIINLFKTKLIFGIPLDVFWDIINMQSNWIFNWIGTENYYFQK